MRARARWLLAAACALVVLVVAGRPWVTSATADPVLGPSRLEVTGGEASPVPAAAAVLALACVLAALLGGRVLRLAAGVGLAIAGVLALGSTVLVMLDPAQAADAALSGRTARTGTSGQVTQAEPTLWPWVGGVAAAAMVVLALVAVVRPGAAPGVAAAGDRVTPAERQGAGDEAGLVDPAAGAEAGRTPDAPPGHDTWDRLSRGEDPTDRR